ncbi:hypothetical protein [Microbulbifer sp. DLAB2-AA]|uniref:hypothetical protein n=1 Tax=Microbulbifer sp. DLAB2-AA TaxID=3243394 RepID=UPI0040396E61
MDYPRREQTYDAETLLGSGLIFQGWVLAKEGATVRPYIRLNSKKYYLKINLSRPDVIRRVLNEESKGHPRLYCGFRSAIPLNSDTCFFGFENNKCDYDTMQIIIEGSLKIIEGLDGWLFLDNDTNQSVEQFTGKLLLDWREKRAWYDYLDSLSKLAEEYLSAHSVLIAPSKEMVMSDYYPHRKGSMTPVEQVEKLADKKHNVVHPVKRMQASKDRVFRVCDTHWTHKGAQCGLLAALEVLGLDTEAVSSLFSGDKFREAVRAGDLGNKIFPRRTARELIPSGISYRQWVHYDNHLPNMGRVLITQNKDALVSAKCLIFGSSSSYTMLDYVSRIFYEVIFVHSAGNIDVTILNQVRPNYLLAQTNGRFVIRAPIVGYRLEDEIEKKWAGLNDKEREEIIVNQDQWIEKCSKDTQLKYSYPLIIYFSAQNICLKGRQ